MGESLEEAQLIAALATLKSMLQATIPMYGEVARMAVDSDAHGLAFSSHHMAVASESFYQELESFVYKVMKE